MGKSPKKWWQVYKDDAEKRFFVALARHPGFEWRTTDALARESQLKKAEVEGIISRYHKAGIVLQHPRDPEKWGYWERVSPQSANATTASVAEADQKKRVDKATPKKK